MIAEQTVEQLPIGKVRPAPDNPRRDVGDLTELAQSISEAGIVQPIVAVPRTDGTYMVVVGARRLAAAAKAGLATVPVIVRDLSEQDRILAMTIENLQREDLTPLEEANGYQRLLDELKVSQHELAPRVGKTQSHISKRLSLLALPKDVQAKVDSGGIEIAAALVLAKLATVAGAQAVSTLVKGRPALTTDYGYLAKRELDRLEEDAAFRKTKDELKASGVKLLSPVKDRYGNFDLPKGAIEITKAGGFYSLKLDPAKHIDEPCHAAVLFADSHKVKFVCTNRKRHPNLKTQEEGFRRGSSRRNTRERGDELQVKAAAKTRNAFVAELLERKTAIPKADATRLIFDAYIDRAMHVTKVRAAKLLGLEPIEKRSTYGGKEKDYTTPLRNLASTSDAELLRVCLALTFATEEERLNSTYTTNWTEQREYLELLEQHGHALTPIEKKRMGSSRPKAAKEA